MNDLLFFRQYEGLYVCQKYIQNESLYICVQNEHVVIRERPIQYEGLYVCQKYIQNEGLFSCVVEARVFLTQISLHTVCVFDTNKPSYCMYF